ncbi:hypothetical protein A4A49_65077, partial [Nicotiana attenuata]
WIIDTGASHHVTPHKEVLDNIRKIENQNNSAVQVPTGGKCHVEHTGNVKMLDELILKDVLHVPDFKFNLMSVSKLTKELSCCVAFFPHFCMFQCLYSGKVLGIGDKFAPRARRAVLIGYSETQKGYRLYDMENRTFLVSRDVVFREHVFPFKGMVSDLEDILPQDPPALTPIDIQPHPTQTENILPNITHTEPQEHLHEALNKESIDQLQPLNQEEADTSMSSDSLAADIVEETEETSPAEEVMNVRKSVRTSRPPIWMKDYVAPGK